MECEKIYNSAVVVFIGLLNSGKRSNLFLFFFFFPALKENVSGGVGMANEAPRQAAARCLPCTPSAGGQRERH